MVIIIFFKKSSFKGCKKKKSQTQKLRTTEKETNRARHGKHSDDHSHWEPEEGRLHNLGHIVSYRVAWAT